MRWKFAGAVALGAILACAMQMRAVSGQENQQKSDADKAQAAKAQKQKTTASNALSAQANTAMQEKQWQKAVDLFKQLIEIDPDTWSYRQGMGYAQLNLGQYDDALKSYDAGIKLAEEELENKAPVSVYVSTRSGIALMLINEGNIYLKLQKNDLAIGAYTKAADTSPEPAVAYFNLCATQYNIGNMAAAEAACDKAIAADPKMADAYFIKGSALYGDGKSDAKGNFVLPPGTVEALKKYMELAPEGAHAGDVKAMLDAAGVKY